MAVPKPDYLSRDYEGLRSSLLSYASQAFPEWQPGSSGDFGVVMLDLFSYMGDVLSYYTDRAQFENYLATATQRDSVLGIAYLMGYLPNSGTPAKGTVTLVTDKNMGSIVVPAGTQIVTGRIAALDGPVTFETEYPVTLAEKGGTNTPVSVVEGVTEAYVQIGESTGQPSQIFVLPHTGVYRDTVEIFVQDGTGSTVFTSGVTPVTARAWQMVDHLLDAGPGDFVFETQFRNTSMLINFGDDINGAIPATGIKIFASYRHGVGSSGNVPAGQVRLINDRTIPGVSVARTGGGAFLSSAMIGGTDPESVESIRYNAPRVYRTQDRVVNEQDYVDLALGVEGVSKANVLVGSPTSVTVFIAGADGSAPSETLKNVVAAQLQSRSLAGADVTVSSPSIVPVNFGSDTTPITVELYPQFSQATARAAVERTIRYLVASAAFGDKLSVGQLYRSLAVIDGVRNVAIPVMARDDAPQTGTVTLNPREWELFTVGDIFLDIDGGVV